MAATFGLSTIHNAQPYWLEQIPYTAVIGSLAAGGQTALIPAIQGWQGRTTATTLVALESLGATQWTGVQVEMTNDHAKDRYDLGTWQPNLDPVPVDRVAFENLSAKLYNTTSTAVTNLQLVYRMTVWQMPVAVKVLWGLKLTPQETAVARAVGLDTAPNNQRGTLPLTLDRIIEGTFKNRLVRARLNTALLGTASTSSAGLSIHRYQVEPNTIAILRSVAMAGTLEDGVQLHVDRDTTTDHVILDAAALSLDRPLMMWIPATDSLNFRLTATTTPPAQVPVRLEIWTVSLSNILRVRLGASMAEIEQLMGSPANGQKLYASVKAGMN